MKAQAKALYIIRVIKVLFVLQAALLMVSSAYADTDIDTWSVLQEMVDRVPNRAVITLSEDLTALETDVALNIPAGKSLTLDLNGYTLDRNRKKRDIHGGSVIHIEAGAVLTLRDSVGTGIITGGDHDDGGGILNHGTLILEGGSVTGNTALHSGGGIANCGTMLITGGRVTGNTALEEGGGLFNHAKARLTMNSDIVFGNSAPKDQDIANDGAMTVIGIDGAETRIEDMPVIKRFMAQQAIIPTVALLIALLLAVWLDDYLGRDRKRGMVIIIALVFSLILQNYLDNRLSNEGAYNALRMPVTIYGYAVRPVLLAMFLYILKPEGHYRAVWALVAVNAAIYLTAFFSDVAFQFTVNGHFKAGPLRHTCTVVSAVLFGCLLCLTIRRFHPRRRKESWIPMLVTALIAGAVVMDVTVIYKDQPVSFLTVAIAISCVFYYIWLHLQFVREHEEALRAGQRIQIMMSQIQPHFLFNTLSTIQALCAKDPPMAIHAIERFGVYLRRNIEVLGQTELIPLTKELEHTRAYAEIEKLRFSNIHVDYDIQMIDIRVPALSIQPLVENAIRHGVRGRKEGRVAVSTRRAGNEDQIVIRDNGKGFDVSVVKEDGGAHIGIANVRSRLEQMCGGRLDIDSRIGEGTTIVMHIPISMTQSKQNTFLTV